MTDQLVAEQSTSPSRPRSAAGGGFPAPLVAEAAEVLDDVRNALGRDLDDARLAALRLVRLLASPVMSRSANFRGGLAPWQKRKIDQYVGERLGQVIRVEDLADLVGLSVSHFCRAFKGSYAETPHTYIMRRRLEQAQWLMLTTREPLSQIALDCGLSDQAHLSKLFRRRVGETPSAWRRLSVAEAAYVRSGS